MSINKLTYPNKENKYEVKSEVLQVTAGDLNQIKTTVNGLVDAVYNSTRQVNALIDAGTTEIPFATAFDPAVVDSARFAPEWVRRESDGAVVDFTIDAISLTGVTLSVWDDGVRVIGTAISKLK